MHIEERKKTVKDGYAIKTPYNNLYPHYVHNISTIEAQTFPDPWVSQADGKSYGQARSRAQAHEKPKTRCGMIKIHRLQSAKDFRALFRFGRRRESVFFKVTTRPNGVAFSRFAFIAAKSVDKRAVVRNRLRRRCREWVRTHLSPPSISLDVAIFFEKEAKGATQKEFYKDLALLFRYYGENSK